MPNTAKSDNSELSPVAGKKIILGVTGSIAAYKAAYLASGLVQRGADVHVVMTEHAAHLVGEPTFWSITRNAVTRGLFTPPATFDIAHVSLPESANLMLVAPATASIIAKLAYGLADDMLSTMALATKCPRALAPAMNVNMYTDPVVSGNLDRLRQLGWTVIEPETGNLACGAEGKGRLAEPDCIISRVEEILRACQQDYARIDVLVTAGPTREPIDPVRFISNRSSGKMGYAIAETAAARGAKVCLVSGPTELAVPKGVELVAVNTVGEMRDAVISRVSEANLFISAGAPADFTPTAVSGQKIKKQDKLTLELDRAPDILDEVGKNKGKTVLVGFAAETSDLEKHAAQKLQAKNLDLIVANDVSSPDGPFGSDSNQVTVISRDGDKAEWPRMSKREVANAILDYVRDHFMEALR